MRRFVLLGLLLGALAAATGCQTAGKKEAVGAAEASRWTMPRYIYEDNWWGRNEMGGLDR